MDDYRVKKVNAINPLVTRLSDKNQKQNQENNKQKKEKEFNDNLESEIKNINNNECDINDPQVIHKINLVVGLIKRGFSIKEVSDLTFFTIEEVSEIINKDLKKYDLNLYNEVLEYLKRKEFERFRHR